MRILVVDDSSTLRAMIKFHLKRAGGSEAFYVENGQEAVDWIRANGDPDLILLDINMPVMNGLEFLRRRVGLGVSESVPIIILSTEGKEDDVQRGLDSGARAYLRKPFTSPQLGEVIQRVLEART